jgi:hypothetical protein
MRNPVRSYCLGTLVGFEIRSLVEGVASSGAQNLYASFSTGRRLEAGRSILANTKVMVPMLNKKLIADKISGGLDARSVPVLLDFESG